MPSISVSFGQKELGSNRTNGVGRVWMMLNARMSPGPWYVVVDRKRTFASRCFDDRNADAAAAAICAHRRSVGWLKQDRAGHSVPDQALATQNIWRRALLPEHRSGIVGRCSVQFQAKFGTIPGTESGTCRRSTFYSCTSFWNCSDSFSTPVSVTRTPFSQRRPKSLS